MQIGLHIDTIKYSSKPKDFAPIKGRFAKNIPVSVAISELISKIEQGYTICPAIMDGGASAANWTQQAVFLVDIDNDKDEPILSVSKALAICKTNNILPAFYYYTFSHSDSKPKFRLVFICNEIITDTSIRAAVVNALIALFPQSDKACGNADRIFLGTNSKAVICDLEATFTIENALSSYAAVAQKPMPKPVSTADKDLDKLKREFDFLGYLKQRNGEFIFNNAKSCQFAKCEICGHSRDLTYYYQTNTFMCFSSSGNIGGSIIDYLMAAQRKSLTEAIDHFKHELCGLPRIAKAIEIPKQPKAFETFSAAELIKAELKPIYFVVDNLLPQGLTLLCSPPKYGKSWCVIDLCLSVAAGLPFLGRQTKQSNTLYLALEDSRNRLQDRLNKVLQGSAAPSSFDMTINACTLSDGLIEQLQSYITAKPNTKLIVIDTLAKIRGIQSRTDTAYGFDYREIGLLKHFADKYSICVLLVHHLRKAADDTDVFMRISGTNGISGAADTMLVMSKAKRTETDTTLSITGRDVEQNEILINFDKTAFKWRIIGNADEEIERREIAEYKNNPIVKTIKLILKECPYGWKGTARELFNICIDRLKEMPTTSESDLSKKLKGLQRNLLEIDRIIYQAPPPNGSNGKRTHHFKNADQSNLYTLPTNDT